MNEKEIHERMEAFDEATNHLDACELDSTSEERAYDKVAKMIRTLAEGWFRKRMAALDEKG